MEKTDVPGICKVREGVLINTDNSALAAYKRKKQKSIELNKMQEEMSQLKDDIAEIKALLKGLAK